MTQMSQTPQPAPAAVSPGGPVLERTSPNNAPAAPGPSAPASAPPKAPAPPAPPARRIPNWVLALGAGLIAVAAYVYVPRLFVVETDDAYVQADTVTIMPKVAAYVTALHVTDNSAFTAGELLVELDPRDFQVAVATAEASLESAEAALANAIGQLNEQNEIMAADAAKVQGDRATVAFAGQQLSRFGALAKEGAATTENWQQAQSDIGVQQATQQSDTATLNAARAQIDVLQSQVAAGGGQCGPCAGRPCPGRAQPVLHENLCASVRDRRQPHRAGRQFVQPGQALFSAVPNQVYVIANFKETQLTNMRVGQKVDITVDAFPGLKLHGYRQ